VSNRRISRWHRRDSPLSFVSTLIVGSPHNTPLRLNIRYLCRTLHIQCMGSPVDIQIESHSSSIVKLLSLSSRNSEFGTRNSDRIRCNPEITPRTWHSPASSETDINLTPRAIEQAIPQQSSCTDGYTCFLPCLDLSQLSRNHSEWQSLKAPRNGESRSASLAEAVSTSSRASRKSLPSIPRR
jgi:hypothetical protein